MISLVSIYFLIFLCVVTLLYYLLKGSAQWKWLLIASLIFYALASGGFLVFVLAEAVIIYAFTKVFETKKIKWLFVIELILIFGLVVVLKYASWFGEGFAGLLSGLNIQKESTGGAVNYIVPLGISYFSMSGMSYSIDVFRDKYPAEKNFAKVLMFMTFFPALTQGPINRYDDLNSGLFSYHKFRYENLTNGILRMIWGFFKKLVIADRLYILLGNLTEGWGESAYSGGWIILAIVISSLNLFIDFSGCMDIALGASEILGIELPENFDHPYLSKTIPEFWRKWHITLGAWLRDYVMFSFIMSRPAKAINKKVRNRIGKKGASMLISCAGIFLVWLCYGLWHGLEMRYLVTGLYYAAIFIIPTVLEGPVKKFNTRFPSLVKSKPYTLFSILRTDFMSMFAAIFFFMPSLSVGMGYLANVFKPSTAQIINIPETGIEKVTDIKAFGMDILDFSVIIIAIALWIVITTLHKKKDIRERLSNINIVLRWLIIFAVLMVVIIVGNYGGNMDAGSFIYQGF